MGAEEWRGETRWCQIEFSWKNIFISCLTPCKDMGGRSLTLFTALLPPDLFSILNYCRGKSKMVLFAARGLSSLLAKRDEDCFFWILWCWMNKWCHKSVNTGKGNASFKLLQLLPCTQRLILIICLTAPVVRDSEHTQKCFKLCLGFCNISGSCLVLFD